MRKSVAGLATVLFLAAAPAVSAQHPSENRAEQGFGGGPHCHVNLQSGTTAFPSHTAHLASGTEGAVFAATTCPTVP